MRDNNKNVFSLVTYNTRKYIYVYSVRLNKDIVFKWRAVLAEFIGTLIFVFIGTMSAVTAIPADPKLKPENMLLKVALGHIFALIIIIHAFGPISGAHVNPAVTLATMVTRHVGIMTGLLYMIAQLLGGIAGAALTLFIGGRNPAELGAFVMGDDYKNKVWEGFALEIILTVILVMTIFGTAVKSQHLSEDTGLEAMTGLFGFPIGIALGACIFAGGSVTGASMNPAHALGPYLLSWYWPNYCWIYFTAPFIGAVIGGVLYEFVLTKPRPRRSYIKLQ